MEQSQPGPNKGYQKKAKTPVQNAGHPQKAPRHVDYSSPAAKKWPLLTAAVEGGNVDAVKQLIDEGLSVNVLRDGVTPLMLAAAKGQVKIAEVLLQAGANVNERNDEGRTAMHAAAQQSHTAVVDLLLQAGSTLDATDRSGRTALHLAEECGHRDIVRLIRSHQQQRLADSEEWESFLRSPEGKPYRLTRQCESLESFSRLWWLPFPALAAFGLLIGLLAGAAVLSTIIGAALAGIAVGALAAWRLWAMNTLARIGPLPELDIHLLRKKRAAGEPLGIAMQPKPPAAVQVSGMPATDAPQSSPVLVISEELPAREPSDAQGRSPAAALFGRISGRFAAAAAALLVVISLAAAVAVKKDAIARWYYAGKLERQGMSVSSQGFLDAVAKDQREAVDLFLRAGIPVDAQDADGRTALAVACDAGRAAMAGKLAALAPGLLHRPDGKGDLPLMIASRRGHDEVVAVLAQAGADMNHLVPGREAAASALQAAVDAPDPGEGHLRTIRMLLALGADVNARNAAGRPALLFAVDRGRTDAAALLLEQGADANAVDQNGIFPLLSAACSGNARLVSLLADRGADMKAALPDGWTPLMCASQGGHLAAAGKLIERGAPLNVSMPEGWTALTRAQRMGNLEMVKALLAHGADPAAAYVPESLSTLKGKAVAVKARKQGLGEVLQRIAAAAYEDGYRFSQDQALRQQVSLSVKASWNKALRDLAAKNNLVVVVKGKEVFVIPYDPARVRQQGT